MGMFSPTTVGTPGNVITISTYGSGANPVINNNGVIHPNPTRNGEVVSAGLLLFNAEHVEVNGLDITDNNGGDQDDDDLMGIYVLGEDQGKARKHIYLTDNHIHHVNGAVEKRMRGGIHVHGESPKSSIATTYDDVRIVNVEDEVFQATGLKIGEVTPSSAIVWTRLTSRRERNPSDGPRVEIRYVNNQQDKDRRRGKVEAVVYPAGVTADDLREAVPGAAGQCRVRYRIPGNQEWRSTPWEAVDPERDFTRQFHLSDLQPQSHYELLVEGRADADSNQVTQLDGRFRTAPTPDVPARVVFTVSTGQGNNDQDRFDGFQIYPSMLELKPDFFVHTGDILYYDRLAKTLPLARYHWQRMFSWPTNIAFHRQVASYFEKDDHDTWLNDCWPTMQTDYMHEFTFAQGLEVFLEQVPMSPRTYRTFRWGKDLQIWLVEGRDFRSANDAPDGPDKTIWGTTQKQWFKRTVQESDATFRVLISPTPLVGPDRSKKNDNHANAGFQQEGRELRAFLGSQQNMVVICGDRHWQYMSVDPGTGTREYSCGPASDKHAGGWKQNDYVAEYHRFLRVKGGFLSAAVERESSLPTLTLNFHGVDGTVYHTDSLEAR